MNQIPKLQTAVVFEKHGGPLQLLNNHPVVQQHQLKPGEALVKIEFAGVSHADLHILKGDWPISSKLPLVGGHEGTGRIVAIGDNTPHSLLKVGDAVGIKWLADSCLNCECCRAGQESVCANALHSGFSTDGTFEQYTVSSLRHLTPIPPGMDLAQAAPILGAGVTAWRALKESNTKPGDFIVIAGAGGGVGHLAVQYANAMSLRVIAIDTGSDKKAACLKHGAEMFLDYKESENLIDRIKAATGGMGPHAAIMANDSGNAYDEATQYLRPHGTLIAVGLPAKTEVKINVFWTVFKALRIIGSNFGNRQDAIEALDLAARGKVKPQITMESLPNLETVFRRMDAGQLTGRVVLKTSN